MSGQNGERCNECYFYIADADLHGAGFEAGQCRRFPPSRSINDEHAEILVHPYVHHDGWCGEFKRRPE